MADQSLTYDTSTNLSGNAFNRTGYKFLGWSTTQQEPNVNASALTVNFTDKVTVRNLSTTNGAIVNLYAVWQLLDFNIKLQVEPGAEAILHKVRFGFGYGYLQALPVPTRAGYDFLGWYTVDDNGGTKIVNDTLVNKIGDIKLYAHWDKVISVSTVDISEENDIAMVSTNKELYVKGFENTNLMKDGKYKLPVTNINEIKKVLVTNTGVGLLKSDGTFYKAQTLSKTLSLTKIASDVKDILTATDYISNSSANRTGAANNSSSYLIEEVEVDGVTRYLKVD